MSHHSFYLSGLPLLSPFASQLCSSMKQGGGFSEASSPGCWREVSVGGGIYALRESRSAPHKSGLVIIGSVRILLVHVHSDD